MGSDSVSIAAWLLRKILKIGNLWHFVLARWNSAFLDQECSLNIILKQFCYMLTVGKSNLKIIWMFSRGIVGFGSLAINKPLVLRFASSRRSGLSAVEKQSLPGGLCWDFQFYPLPFDGDVCKAPIHSYEANRNYKHWNQPSSTEKREVLNCWF